MHYYSIGNKFYCVHCLWKKTNNLIPQKISHRQIEEIDLEYDEILYQKRRNQYLDEEFNRIIDADLSYPILIKISAKNRYLIIDGHHRFIKATILEKMKELNCIIVSDEILEQCIYKI
jgi:hypothetical protein